MMFFFRRRGVNWVVSDFVDDNSAILGPDWSRIKLELSVVINDCFVSFESFKSSAG